MKKATSSESGKFSCSAFFNRMATRISSSGGSIDTVSPEEKRDTSRSSMSLSSFG